MCSRPDNVAPPASETSEQILTMQDYTQRCYFTIGPPYIGVDIGLKVDSDSQLELMSKSAATVGDCADWCAETRLCHAFLYHHSALTCELRTGRSLGQKAIVEHCPSTSPACLGRVREKSFDLVGLVPGMQMYFLITLPSDDPNNQPDPTAVTPERYRSCRILSAVGRACRGQSNLVFNETVNPRILARGGTGAHSPSDHMFAAVRLHTDNASSLSRALDILQRGEASQYAAPRGVFTDFLQRRNVIQIFKSSDKHIGAAAEPQVPAEASLSDSGLLLCGAGAGMPDGSCRHNYLTYSAWCDTNADTANVARCSGALNRKPVCGKKWNLDVKRWEDSIDCADGSTPECSVSGDPTCSHAKHLFDDDADGPETVWETNKFQAGVESDFVTVSFSENDNKQHVNFVEVTRIEVQEREDVATGAADSIGVLEVVFSDGKTQQLVLAGHERVVGADQAAAAPPPSRGSADMQVFYIEPAVAHSLTIRVPRLGFYEQQRNPQRRLGLRSLRVWGQSLSRMWEGSVIPMDQPGYTTLNPKDRFIKCPPTTFYSRDWHSCVPCPYPKISNESAVGATDLLQDGMSGVDATSLYPELQQEPSCRCPACGDGSVQWEADEKCDDGNTDSEDGCDSTCRVETSYLCSGPMTVDNVGVPELSYKTADSCFRIGSAWIPYGEAAWPGGARFGASSVLHRNALWLLGGVGHGYKQVFSTVVSEATNGAKCPLRAPTDSCANFPSGTSLEWLVASQDAATPWAARAFLGALVFLDRIYVIGGVQTECVSGVAGSERCDLSRSLGDVWQSSAVADISGGDTSARITWSPVTEKAAWGSRARASVVVFQGAMWLLGGQTIDGPVSGRVRRVYNDVWSSSNGRNWSIVVPNAGWSPRCGHTSAVFPHRHTDAIFVMGGSDESQYFNDVWCSHNGTVWIQLTASAEFSGRWLHTSVAFRDNLWVIGGHACVPPDGTQQPSAYVCTVTNQNAGTFYNDVWYSEDGVHWKASSAGAAWSPRAGHASLVFPERTRENLWVIGGYTSFAHALNSSFAAFTF